MPYKVLLIDDGTVDNYIFELLLKKTQENAKIIICYNGKTAMEHLKRLQRLHESPDYIFVDLTMPTMDGWEFLKQFRKLDIVSTSNSKVYILTSSLFKSDYNKALTFPFIRGFIKKPLNSEKMKELFY
jgi:CheY-like chemotaxis protein